MNKWTIFGVLFFGCLFALFAYERFDAMDSRAVKVIAAAFLFGSYCAIVAFGNADKKRTLSLAGQTVLGFSLAITLAALFDATSEGYILAAVFGLALGFTADKWVEYVQLP
jgi:hypothetical protein